MIVLIIGYGSIGQRHAEILSQFDEVNEIHIVSFYSDTEYKTFKTISYVPSFDIYDYIVISSTTSKHYSQLEYINNKVSDKTILVEKPLFSIVKSLNRIQNNIFVAYNLRFHPIIIELRSLTVSEKVLNIDIQAGQYLPHWRPGTDYTKSYSSSSENGGGVLLDLSHELDYLIWLYGDIESMTSINKKISGLKISSDDYFTAIGSLKNGIYFNISMDYLSKLPIRTIRINTESKTIHADLIEGSITISDTKSNKKVLSFDVERNDSYIAMHRNILFEKDNVSAATYKEGLRVLDHICAIKDKNK